MQSSLSVLLRRAALGGVILLLSLLTNVSNASQRLLPFQGHLTDATGDVIGDGARVVQFKIYDAPVSGTAVWAGEVHKLSVNGGLVNTILGTKTSMENVDFASPLYLEITIDADSSETIDAADPPLLPRQIILPSVFAIEAEIARDSTQLDGHDWSSILDSDDPSVGKLRPGVFAASSISNGILTTNMINPEQLLDLLIPAGTIVPFAGSVVPPGWKLCDGKALNSTADGGKFARLHAAILTAWGDGSEASGGVADGDFNLPDLQGFFLRGVSGNSNVDPDKDARTPWRSGGNSGNQVGSWQDEQFKQHRHGLAYQPGGGNHPLWGDGGSPEGTTGPAGGSETRPKNAYVNYIIKY